MGRADAPWLPLLLLCSSCCFCIWPQKQILVAADTDPNDGKLESGIFSPFCAIVLSFFLFCFCFRAAGLIGGVLRLMSVFVFSVAVRPAGLLILALFVRSFL